MIYKFEMPWPPSVNGYWRSYKGRQIISERGRKYRKAAMAHLYDLGLSLERIDFKVSVTLVLNPPTLSSYDVDNFNKGLFDSLTAAKFWNDDSQVHRLTVSKGVKVKGGNVQVKVEVME